MHFVVFPNSRSMFHCEVHASTAAPEKQQSYYTNSYLSALVGPTCHICLLQKVQPHSNTPSHLKYFSVFLRYLANGPYRIPSVLSSLLLTFFSCTRSIPHTPRSYQSAGAQPRCDPCGFVLSSNVLANRDLLVWTRTTSDFYNSEPSSLYYKVSVRAFKH